jgi:hypothetical protein
MMLVNAEDGVEDDVEVVAVDNVLDDVLTALDASIALDVPIALDAPIVLDVTIALVIVLEDTNSSCLSLKGVYLRKDCPLHNECRGSLYV